MTAVDHAELKRLAEGAKERAALLRRLEALSEVADALEAMADGTCALLSEIEGLKTEDQRNNDELLALIDRWEVRALEAERLLAAPRTQAPDSWRPDREAVARLVDAWAFEFVPWNDNWKSVVAKRQAEALAKADAILALRPQTAESGK